MTVVRCPLATKKHDRLLGCLGLSKVPALMRNKFTFNQVKDRPIKTSKQECDPN